MSVRDLRAELRAAVKDVGLYARDAGVMTRRRPTPEMLVTLEARLAGVRRALEEAERLVAELKAQIEEEGG